MRTHPATKCLERALVTGYCSCRKLSLHALLSGMLLASENASASGQQTCQCMCPRASKQCRPSLGLAALCPAPMRDTESCGWRFAAYYGHKHTYQRTQPLVNGVVTPNNADGSNNGTIYYTAGNAGAAQGRRIRWDPL